LLGALLWLTLLPPGLLLGALLWLTLLLPGLLLGALLWLTLLLPGLLLGALLWLTLLLPGLLLGTLLRLTLLLPRLLLLLLLLLLRGPCVFFALLLLSIRGAKSEKKKEQNSGADKACWFHERYLHDGNRMHPVGASSCMFPCVPSNQSANRSRPVLTIVMSIFLLENKDRHYRGLWCELP